MYFSKENLYIDIAFMLSNCLFLLDETSLSILNDYYISLILLKDKDFSYDETYFLRFKFYKTMGYIVNSLADRCIKPLIERRLYCFSKNSLLRDTYLQYIEHCKVNYSHFFMFTTNLLVLSELDLDDIVIEYMKKIIYSNI